MSEEKNIGLGEQLEKDLDEQFNAIIERLCKETGISNEELSEILGKDKWGGNIRKLISSLGELTEYSKRNKKSAGQQRRGFDKGRTRDYLYGFLNEKHSEESLSEIAEYFLFVLAVTDQEIQKSLNSKLGEKQKQNLLIKMAISAFGERSDTLPTELQILLIEYLSLSELEKAFEYIKSLWDIVEKYPFLLSSIIGVFLYAVGVMSQLPNLDLSQFPRAALVDTFTMFANNFGMGFEIRHLQPNNLTQFGPILAGLGPILSVFPQINRPIANVVEDVLHKGRKIKNEIGHIILVGKLGEEEATDLVAKSGLTMGNKVVSVTETNPKDGSVWYKSDPANLTSKDLEKMRTEHSSAICVKFENDNATIARGLEIMQLLKREKNNQKILLVLEKAESAEGLGENIGFEILVEEDIIQKAVDEYTKMGYDVVYEEDDDSTMVKMAEKTNDGNRKVAVLRNPPSLQLPKNAKHIVISDILQTELFAKVYRLDQPKETP